jgi:cell division protein FtsN
MSDYKSSNMDTIVKIILVFFISLLSFSIGTFVGKKFSDNQHKLSTLEPVKNEEKAVSATGHSGPSTAEDTLSDDQVAALANEFVDDETLPAGKSEVAGHDEADTKGETADHGKTKTKSSTSHNVETKDADNTGHIEASSHSNEKTETHANTNAEADIPKSDAAKHEPVIKKDLGKIAAAEKTVQMAEEDKAAKEALAKIPSGLAKEKAASGNAKFTIQIASYPSETEAQKKADELKKLNFEAFYTPATIKGQTWYRVNVGSFATSREAQDHKADLIEKAHISSAIIQKLIQ